MLQPLTQLENLRYIINHDVIGRYTYSSHELWNPISNSFDMQNEWYYLYNSQTAIHESMSKEKTLLSIVDILGKTTKPKKNTQLFYIFDDGTIENKIILE
jgi:hypothetical protein